MKKIVLLGAVVFCLAACENSGKSESEVDTLKESLDTTLKKIGDSAKAKGEKALEAIKEKVREIEIDVKNDSIKMDSVQ